MDRKSLFTLLLLVSFLLPVTVLSQTGFIDIDTSFIHIDDCEASASLCLSGFPLASALNHTYTIDGNPYEGTVQGCDFDTISAFTYSTLFGQGNLGPYQLDNWSVNNMVFSGLFQNIPDLVDSMNLWDPLGNWQLDEGALLIIGGFPGNTYSDMDVTVIAINSPSFIGYNFGLDAQGTEFVFGVGFHEVIVTNNVSLESDTFYVSVNCASLETVYVQLQPGQVSEYCPDLSELSGNIVLFQNICPEASGTSANISAQDTEFCFDLMALTPGFDTACIVLCDDFGACDTTTLIVQVIDIPVNTDIVTSEIYLGNIVNYCLDTSQFTANIAMIDNICPELSGTDVNFILIGNTWCVTYEGLEWGTDTACIVLTALDGMTDTTYFYISVIPPTPDTVFVSIPLGDNGQYCVEIDELGGVLNSLVNGCEDNATENVNFTVNGNTFCVDYEAANAGQDTACLWLSDSFGITDTTILIVTVTTSGPSPEVVLDTIIVGETLTYCIDTTELSGNVTVFDNLCFDLSGNEVSFVLDSTNWCVIATGLAAGIDTACIIICDVEGICDTTTFIYTSLPPISGSPVAINDLDTTTQQAQVVILVFNNDILPLGPTDFGIVAGTAPAGGVVDQIGTGVLSYTPDEGFCGLDSFQYYVCIGEFCDTATVYVLVQCDSELTFYSAITPDGDGSNDVWIIEGLYLATEHQLRIFNRWGLQVFESEDYQNDWGGQWNGKDLPDGTYFYVFEDLTAGEKYSGYIQIYH